MFEKECGKPVWLLNLAAHVRKEHPDVDLDKENDNKGIQKALELMKKVNKCKATAH